MAAPMPPDDVAALMTRVELDRSQYKVFERPTVRRAENTAPAFHPPAEPMRPRIAPVPEAVPQPARPRWNLLNSLLSSAISDEASTSPEALLVPMLAVSAGPGGVGKTTIISTIARILSGLGESVFLVYSDSQRSLPLHLGGQQVVPGRVRTFLSPAADCGPMHLFAHALGSEPNNLDVSWLPQQVNPMVAEVGRVLCEVTNTELPARQLMDLAQVNLRVLVPDINSVLSVNQDLARQEAEPESAPFYYILNKFDSTVAFHVNVRERLQGALGDQLLPFTIRRTDQVAEALAAGVTVVDYAPEAPVTEDFRLLAQWLRNTMSRNEVRDQARRFL